MLVAGLLINALGKYLIQKDHISSHFSKYPTSSNDPCRLRLYIYIRNGFPFSFSLLSNIYTIFIYNYSFMYVKKRKILLEP